MAKKRKRRTHRSLQARITELEERVEELRQQVRDRRKFSPEAVCEERDRLELSAAEYGELVGVSALTIYGWEKGRSQPRPAQLDLWVATRGIGKREAWRRLGLD